MSYMIKEVFRTLQGEGHHTGRVALFCRFSGCNLWSGREEDRSTAQCSICDTDFVGVSARYKTADELADALLEAWGDAPDPFVVLTGGEPLLQVDDVLIIQLHARGFDIAIETNGTIRAPCACIDWICVSPKILPLAQLGGDELKLVYPQPGLEPELFEALHFRIFSLQPLDGPDREKNTEAAIAYCLAHPRWRLSLQTHKWTGIR